VGGDLPGPLAFSPDGKVLAVVLTGLTIQLLDPATAGVLATLEPPEPDRNLPGTLRFSADGSQLAVCTNELRLLHVWDLRLIRLELARLGLDWDAPPYPPAEPAAPRTLEIKVDLGAFDRPPGQAPRTVGTWQGLLQGIGRALAQVREEAETHFQRGKSQYQTGDYRQARDDFNRALRLAPDLVEAYHYRGHVHERLGEYRAAADDFTAALQRQPHNAHFHERRGLAYYHLKEHDRSLADWHESLKLKPDQPVVCNWLAWLYVAGPEKLRDAAKALPLAERAVQRAPGNAAYLTTLGAVHYRLEQYDQAVAKLTEAAAPKEGATASNRFFLAMSYHRQGEKVKARECCDQALAWWKAQTRLTEAQVEQLRALQAEAVVLLEPR
jgi:tetratricopeptide (TPR) repeat protein